MTRYRPGDEPFLITLPPGTDTSKLFRFDPGTCDECEFKAIGSCFSGGRRGAYCSVHKDRVWARVIPIGD